MKTSVITIGCLLILLLATVQAEEERSTSPGITLDLSYLVEQHIGSVERHINCGFASSSVLFIHSTWQRSSIPFLTNRLLGIAHYNDLIVVGNYKELTHVSY
jgi:hypothetical protein